MKMQLSCGCCRQLKAVTIKGIDKDTGTTITASGSLGLNDMASINSLSSKGTPTLANLAPTMKAKAAITRHLYCHRYGNRRLSVSLSGRCFAGAPAGSGAEEWA